MIYPTRLAVLLAAAGAPLALVLALLGGQLWLLGLAWVAAVAGALVADGLLGAAPLSADIGLEAPETWFLGRPSPVEVTVRFPGRAPPWLELALEAGERLEVRPGALRTVTEAREARASFALEPLRRGEGEIRTLWARWTGPLGLTYRQRREAVKATAPIVLDIQAIKEAAGRLASSSLITGAHLQFELGGASEFHALVDYRPGMNRRMIDWKQSARHRQLLAKEFEAERNHHIVLAVDAGRQMCEPVRGRPRVDRALQAGLLLAFGAIKAGDRVGLYAFDEKPRLWTGALGGPGAFPALQRLASRIDYRPAETNYTLGLVQLGAHLQRRSLVVIFTEFTDSTTAELMIEHIGRLMKTHLVVFVVSEDEELEGLEQAEIHRPLDVTKAVMAGALASERELVVSRLRRMGVDILRADFDRLGPALLARYAEIKQRDRL
jgi:uncharacterized protein (DUF58 family)